MLCGSPECGAAPPLVQVTPAPPAGACLGIYALSPAVRGVSLDLDSFEMAWSWPFGPAREAMTA